MNVTLTSLEALILKATHESLPCPDAAALEAFCSIMRDSAEGPQLAVQALAARIHSTNMREAMLALSLVDRCMRRGDPNFHAEVGKFRFLNEMIKLVSPKYLADRTAPEVRTRVLQLLHAWSLEYPKESKFKVAYEMLKFQGVVKETPPPLPPEEGGPPSQIRGQSRAVFKDEEKSKVLQKLLQSKKPDDIQHANRIIKSMVREEELRDAASSRRAREMATARGSANLLIDMLNSAETRIPTAEEIVIMQELYLMCTKLSLMLQQEAELVVHDITAENLSVIDGVIDLLYKVELKYKVYVTKMRTQRTPDTVLQQPLAPSSESLLDFAGAVVSTAEDEPKTNVAKKNAVDELGDIFYAESGSGTDETVIVTQPLKPMNVMPNEDVDLLGDKPKTEGWNELDSLGEQLLKQSLPENARRLDSSFNSKSKAKIPMNALTSPKHEATTSNGAILDLDFFTKKPEELKSPEQQHPIAKAELTNDDMMVDISTEPSANTNNANKADGLILDLEVSVDSNAKHEENLSKERDNREKIAKSCEVKPLTDINVTLQSVTPSKVPPVTAFEEDGGITVVLHLCKDKPRPDVNVVVVSTTSKINSPIEDYKFQSVVPKGCKVRLLTPSGTSLPAYNTFLPPPALTQVMLIARPPTSHPAPINLKFVITYTCNDETCSEMGERDWETTIQLYCDKEKLLAGVVASTPADQVLRRILQDQPYLLIS